MRVISLIVASVFSSAYGLSVTEKANPIRYVGDDTCVMPTKIHSFPSSHLEGTWYVYQHQPDFEEGLFTLGCTCTRSKLSAPKTAGDLFEISNICNYFTTKGPVVNTLGQIKQFNESMASQGTFKFVLNGQAEHYQVLDITNDGKYMLASVCQNNLPTVALRSFCVYFMSRDPPNGKNLPKSILDRFEGVAADLGLLNHRKMRLDYKGTETCAY